MEDALILHTKVKYSLFTPKDSTLLQMKEKETISSLIGKRSHFSATMQLKTIISEAPSQDLQT